MIRNKYGRYVDHYEMYELLGLNPKAHLPKFGFRKAIRVGERVIEFICEPARTDERNSSKHRIKFQCDCGRWIPFGRASQHLPACKGR
jgi:hypothetical protein